MKTLLLLSGPMAVGKSLVASDLINGHGFLSVKTSTFLREEAARRNIIVSRDTLQELGDLLDVETDYYWVIDCAVRTASDISSDNWLLDSVRKERQVAHFRARFGQHVRHAHLVADEKLLRSRYEARLRNDPTSLGGKDYEEAISHPNERASRNLIHIADLVVDVSSLDPAQVIRRITAS